MRGSGAVTNLHYDLHDLHQVSTNKFEISQIQQCETESHGNMALSRLRPLAFQMGLSDAENDCREPSIGPVHDKSMRKFGLS